MNLAAINLHTHCYGINMNEYTQFPSIELSLLYYLYLGLILIYLLLKYIGSSLY